MRFFVSASNRNIVDQHIDHLAVQMLQIGVLRNQLLAMILRLHPFFQPGEPTFAFCNQAFHPLTIFAKLF